MKRDPKLPEDPRGKVANNMYCGFTQDGVAGFQPSTEILVGTNDVISKTVGDNDPKFVNFPLNNPSLNQTFNTAWDFKLTAGSPGIGEGITTFARLYATGLTLANGKTYSSPAPSSTIGVFGTN